MRSVFGELVYPGLRKSVDRVVLTEVSGFGSKSEKQARSGPQVV